MSRLEIDGAAPVVALVGRPNVGKSSLFNRLVGGRPALVEDEPGVTRDRRYGVCAWGAARFQVADTGGLDPTAEGILRAVRAQSLRAVAEAAAVVLVVDAREGVTAVDAEVAKLLRRAGSRVLVAANKVDSPARADALADVYRLGFPSVFPVSAAHGRGIAELLDAVARELGRAEPRPASAGERAATEAIRLAFVGKPNVGKSSLVNRLLGEERVLVHDEPGTTRDPVDTPFRSGGHDLTLVDTAGLRRRRALASLTEKVAARMARDQIDRCDVAALVIDARAGATAEDARLASLIETAGRAAIVVLNKADLVPHARVAAAAAAAKEALGFVAHAPLLLTSAVTGRGVDAIPAAAVRVFGESGRRIPTAEINALFEQIVARHPPPAGPAGRHVRLYYATQAAVRPPTFFVSTNQPAAIGEPYRRFLINRIRAAYGFSGTPVRVVFRGHRGKRGRRAGDQAAGGQRSRDTRTAKEKKNGVWLKSGGKTVMSAGAKR